MTSNLTYTQNDHIVYTYFLLWETGMKYYGIEFGKKKKSNPLNILTMKYRTSSSSVHDYIAKYGYPSTVVVHRTFSNAEEGLLFESSYIKRTKAAHKEDWLNLWEGRGGVRGEKGNKEHSKKMSGENNPMYGKHPSEYTIQRCIEVNTGKKQTKESIEKRTKTRKERGIKPWNDGIPATPETAERLRNIAKMKKPKSPCPYCGKIVAHNIMKRYHKQKGDCPVDRHPKRYKNC